jgi:hypothetical protein
VDSKHVDTWLETGGFSLGPITLEAAMALPSPQLHKLQVLLKTRMADTDCMHSLFLKWFVACLDVAAHRDDNNPFPDNAVHNCWNAMVYSALITRKFTQNS